MALPLRVRGATASFSGKRRLGPIDLDIGPSGATVIIGPNGSGKTTLLKLLHGTTKPASGTINWAIKTSAARKVQGFVFQRPVMLRRSVLQNIAYPLLAHGSSQTTAKTQAREWAKRVGLQDLVDKPARLMSGGEQQKMALARALI